MPVLRRTRSHGVAAFAIAGLMVVVSACADPATPGSAPAEPEVAAFACASDGDLVLGQPGSPEADDEAQPVLNDYGLAPGSRPGDWAGDDCELIAEMKGVPVEQMCEYLEFQDDLGSLVGPLERAIPASQLAGIWLEWTPSPRLVVCIVGHDMPPLPPELSLDGLPVEFRLGAVHSKAQLVSATNMVATRARRDGVGVGTSVSVQTGEIAIYVPPGLSPDIDVDEWFHGLERIPRRVEVRVGEARLAG